LAQHNLDSAPQGGGITFDCQALTSSSLPDGTESVTIKLLPAFDGWGDSQHPEMGPVTAGAKHRVFAVPDTITISSKKLAGIPLTQLNFRVTVVATGSNAGQVSSLYLNATQKNDAQHIESIEKKGRIDVATFFIPRTQTRFKLPLDRNPEGFGVSRKDISGDGLLYLGETGGDLYLDARGWKLVQPEAGPGGSDYSFLKTKTQRGKFD
jgi:hypothetical protein